MIMQIPFKYFGAGSTPAQRGRFQQKNVPCICCRSSKAERAAVNCLAKVQDLSEAPDQERICA